MVHLAGVFIFQLLQAAEAAAIAQGFPFGRRHFIQALALPEGNLGNHF